MPIPYETTCSACGEDLKVTSRKLDSRNDLVIEVAPCKNCLESAKQQARDEEEK